MDNVTKQRLAIDDHGLCPWWFAPNGRPAKAWARRMETPRNMDESRAQRVWLDDLVSYRITRAFVTMRAKTMTPAERVEEIEEFISAELRSATMGRF